ncbi:hypothetical protein [Burkholderia sp. IMCC1007]|uniref:hypothetical protein n=1 Tax=Burkholderia sp. IMCC1007 TaxID=3004104 RepID=UPI0022B5118C|nr:hypothetical protein [Burkholderia sp. IMCC1007]
MERAGWRLFGPMVITEEKALDDERVLKARRKKARIARMSNDRLGKIFHERCARSVVHAG